MMNVKTILDLFQYMEWADAAIWRALPDTDEPDEKLHRQLFHSHFTQLAFLSVWKDDEFKMRKPDEFESLEAIKSEALKFYPQSKAMLAKLIEADLEKEMPMPWAKFFARRSGQEAAITTLGETMTQVAMHTQHHRGQIASRIRELGGDPPLVDYIGWLWFGRPEPEW